MLQYRTPASAWERESLPIGGGALGASVFGSLASEQLTLNEKTLWSGGPGSAGGTTSATGPPASRCPVRHPAPARHRGHTHPEAVTAELGQPRRATAPTSCWATCGST
ncbi:glycoside hydrolase N-terminal domain-containing protein [Streptomyces sp. M10(2022)]